MTIPFSALNLKYFYVFVMVFDLTFCTVGEFCWRATDNDRKGMRLLSSIVKYHGKKKFRSQRSSKPTFRDKTNLYNQALQEYQEKRK